MHPLAKVFIGVILMIVSVAVIYEFTLRELWIVLQGILPPLAFLIGLFIVWLEWDEWKIERELKAEEEKEKEEKVKEGKGKGKKK
jgi:cadmium resistance protein CadD (predicted permease)